MNLAIDRPFQGERWRSRMRTHISGVVQRVTKDHVLFKAKGFGVTSVPLDQFIKTFRRDEPNFKIILGKPGEPAPFR